MQRNGFSWIFTWGVSVDDQPFRNEYPWFIEFDNDGKIIQVIEMVDSGLCSTLFTLLNFWDMDLTLLYSLHHQRRP